MKHERYRSTKTIKMALSQGLVTSVLVLIVGMMIAPAAVAGNCKDTNRHFSWTAGKAGADSTVQNQTKNKTFMVEVLRDGNVKQSKQVAPGENASRLVKFPASDTSAPIEIRVNIWDKHMGAEGRKFPAYCIYQVRATSSQMTWTLSRDPICADVAALCPTCTISCEKSYRSGKGRYNTVFTITN